MFAITSPSDLFAWNRIVWR